MERVTVKREELYEQVWSKPMTRLAKGYGISDVGLAKICKKMEIPRPPQGYWAKLAAGKAVPLKPKLKPLSEKGQAQAIISPTPEYLLTDQATREAVIIDVPDELHAPHRLTKKTRAAFRRGKLNERGIAQLASSIYLDLNITKSSLDRACLIMDSLVKALEERGHHVSVSEDKQTKTIITINGQLIQIGLDERVRRTKHELTETENRRWGRGLGYHFPMYDYHPTGKLVLLIRDYTFGLRQQWADGKVQKVEDCLGSFVQGLEAVAEDRRRRAKDREREQREWVEEQRRRAELKCQQDIEEARVKKLNMDMEAWENAARLRRYLDAIGKLDLASEDIAEWLAWGRQYVELLDPLCNPEGLVFRVENYPELQLDAYTDRYFP